MTEKVCRKCGETKPIDLFYRVNKDRPRRHGTCKACSDLYKRAWERANAQRMNARRAAAPGGHHRFNVSRYGLTYDDYLGMASQQGGVCRICGDPPRRRHLSVDHDHRTGKVRGLLCENCNAALGQFKDSLERLQAASAYLVAASCGTIVE